LRHAIDSVIGQSYASFELIIVDDGSTDDPGDVCKSYLSDPRVRYIRKENGGIASARNAGIAAASAPLICFLDDDDVWMSNKLEAQVDVFERNSPKPGLVYCAIEVTDAAGHVIGRQYHAVPGDPYRALFFENVVDATSGVMVSAEALRDVGTFREKEFSGSAQACEDRELWTRVARKYRLVSIPQALVRYRMHDVKLSTTADVMEPSELKMLDIALSEAPDDIRAQETAIYHSLYTRFASNRFSTGDYPEFYRHYEKASELGPMPLGLRLRYFAAKFPPLVALLRLVLSVTKRNGRPLPAVK
jgi:glycosyltransferase involved in cell wall biosynthesis